MPSSLSRRPTCPVTRKESEQLMDFFINLPTTPSAKQSSLDNFNNNLKNDSKCHCNKERPIFMRSDSYRKATQVFQEIDFSDSLKFNKENYDPRKYLSLPVDKRSKVDNAKTKTTSKSDKSNKSTLDKKKKLDRQKSGTVPSSDSDNQMSPDENRKKKSVFKRTKERIIFKLWKDKKRSEHKEKSSVTRTWKSTQHEVVLEDVKTTKENDKNARINQENVEINRKPTKSPIGSEKSTEEHSSPGHQMAPAPGRRFKTQVSREEVTNMFEKILTSAEVRDEPFKFPNTSSSHSNLQRSDFNHVSDTSHADGIRNKKSSLSLDLVPFTPSFTTSSRVLTSNDKIETIVDKNGATHTIHTHTTTLERTFSLEVDGGFDDVDGPVESPSRDGKDKTLLDAKETTSNQDPLSPTEQEKMIEEIARRLNRIADDCVQRMESGESQARGAVATPLLSPNSRSRKLANDLVTELRKEGDRLSRELDLPDSLLPIVMDMVKQITYDHFKKCVKRALNETIGWDQVAMYLYVSRAAIMMAGIGGQMAIKLKDMAVRYFHEELSPWICDKGGLETMLTETDSELD